MSYTFPPIETVSFSGPNKNPLPSPPWQNEISEGANVLQQLNDQCVGTGAIPAVSAMWYRSLYLSGSAFASVTLGSLANSVSTETSIDILLRVNPTLSKGFTTEISKSAAGGYHFDCINYDSGALVFSEDFSQVPHVGDIVTIFSDRLTQGVYVNGVQMVVGTSPAQPFNQGDIILQINSGVVLTDPAISSIAFGKPSLS